MQRTLLDTSFGPGTGYKTATLTSMTHNRVASVSNSNDNTAGGLVQHRVANGSEAKPLLAFAQGTWRPVTDASVV